MLRKARCTASVTGFPELRERDFSKTARMLGRAFIESLKMRSEQCRLAISSLCFEYCSRRALVALSASWHDFSHVWRPPGPQMSRHPAPPESTWSPCVLTVSASRTTTLLRKRGFKALQTQRMGKKMRLKIRTIIRAIIVCAFFEPACRAHHWQLAAAHGKKKHTKKERLLCFSWPEAFVHNGGDVSTVLSTTPCL